MRRWHVLGMTFVVAVAACSQGGDDRGDADSVEVVATTSTIVAATVAEAPATTASPITIVPSTGSAPTTDRQHDPEAPTLTVPVADQPFSMRDAGMKELVFAQFTPDGSRVAVVGQEGGGASSVVQFIEPDTGAQHASIPVSGSFCSGLPISPDGALLFDGANLRDTTTGMITTTIKDPKARTVGADFSADGTLVAVSRTGPESGSVSVYDVATGNEIISRPFASYLAVCGEFLPGGHRVILSGQPPTVWDIASDRDVRVQLPPGAGITGDGTLIVSMNGLFDISSGEVVLGYTGYPRALSASGDRLITQSMSVGQPWMIWDVPTRTKTAEVSCYCGVQPDAFNPDGSRLVLARDGVGEIYDATNGELIKTLTLDDALVLSAAYSPDGTRIVTANSNGTVRIWDDP